MIHNDYKFDNVIFDPSLERITGVLDWEMATIGDPLMDLGTSISYWVHADDPQILQMPIFGVTMKPGMFRLVATTLHAAAVRYSGAPWSDCFA